MHSWEIPFFFDHLATFYSPFFQDEAPKLTSFETLSACALVLRPSRIVLSSLHIPITTHTDFPLAAGIPAGIYWFTCLSPSIKVFVWGQGHVLLICGFLAPCIMLITQKVLNKYFIMKEGKKKQSSIFLGYQGISWNAFTKLAVASWSQNVFWRQHHKANYWKINSWF